MASLPGGNRCGRPSRNSRNWRRRCDRCASESAVRLQPNYASIQLSLATPDIGSTRVHSSIDKDCLPTRRYDIGTAEIRTATQTPNARGHFADLKIQHDLRHGLVSRITYLVGRRLVRGRSASNQQLFICASNVDAELERHLHYKHKRSRDVVSRTLGISRETRLNDERPDGRPSSKILWVRQLHALVGPLAAHRAGAT
jgi:hypothetical protein